MTLFWFTFVKKAWVRIQEFSQKGGFSQMTSKVDWFSVGFDVFPDVNPAPIPPVVV